MARAARWTLVMLILLAAFPAAGPPAAARTPATAPLPSSIAAIGDSITTATNACCLYRNWPSLSWATGSFALDATRSHYERILEHNPAIQGRLANNAVPGAKVADAPQQARRVVAQRAEYVTILIGANDLCAAGGMTSPEAFRASFEEALAILAQELPQARVFVASIPNLYRLWQALRDDPAAQRLWDAARICPPLLGRDRTEQERQAVLERERQFNRIMEAACARYPTCRFDGYAVFNYPFTRAHVSRLDYFHPSTEGQAMLAEVTWGASWWEQPL